MTKNKPQDKELSAGGKKNTIFVRLNVHEVSKFK